MWKKIIFQTKKIFLVFFSLMARLSSIRINGKDDNIFFLIAKNTHTHTDCQLENGEKKGKCDILAWLGLACRFFFLLPFKLSLI